MSVNLTELLQGKRQVILEVAAKHGASNVRVFGSMVQGAAGPTSDIDLVVKMTEERSLLDLIALTLELQDLLGVQVDVVSEDGLYWLLRRKILKEARPL